MSVRGVGAALYLKVRADLNFFIDLVVTSYSKSQVIFDGVAVCTHRMSEAREERAATGRRAGSLNQSGT